MPWPSDVALLGTLPPALRTAMAAAPFTDGTCGITSALSSISFSPGTGALTVGPDATVTFVDAKRGLRWTAQVRLLAQQEELDKDEEGNQKKGDMWLREGAGIDPVPLNPWRTLCIEESTWTSGDIPVNTAQEPASNSDGRASPQASVAVSAVAQTAKEEAPSAASPPLPAVPAVTVRAGDEQASSSVASPTMATGATVAKLTNTNAFHFFVDQTLDKVRHHAGAARMGLCDILTFSTPPSSSSPAQPSLPASPFSDEMVALIEPLLVDLAHFLAPAPRSLRDVLHFIFGGTLPSQPASAATSPFYFSFSHCPRSPRYKEYFSLSDVKHLAELLSTTNAKGSSPQQPQAALLLLHLNGSGFCFLDIDKYASTLEKQRAANRAYVPLANLVEQSMLAAAAQSKGTAREAGRPQPFARIVPFADGFASGAQGAAAAASPLIRKYFDEATVARKILSMEPFVDRDTVLSVRSKGGGIMQGLATKVNPLARPSGEREEQWFKDGSAANSEDDGDDEEGKAVSSPVVQYTSLQDTRIGWKEGDLTSFLPDGKVPEVVGSVLCARREHRNRQLASNPHSNPTSGEETAAGAAAVGTARKKLRTEADPLESPLLAASAALTDPSPSTALDPLPILTVAAYERSLAEYEVLQGFSRELAARLQRYCEVSRAASEWAQRVDRTRWTASFAQELKAYFDRNSKKAAWLADLAATVGEEGYRLERELRDFVCLSELGVLPLQ